MTKVRGYGLTLRPVQRDRSGSPIFTLTDRIQNEFERRLRQYATLTRPLSSSMRAHRCFDFLTHSILLPSVCIFFLAAIWSIACGITLPHLRWL